MNSPLTRRPSARDYVTFYNFAAGLLQEIIGKPNLFSFIIKPSFSDIELLSVSINEQNEICWEYGLWDNNKDSRIYFSEDSAVDKYRYQILRPNPSLFFAKGILPKEAYSYTLSLLSNKDYPPFDEKISVISIDGTINILDLPNIHEYGWNGDLPNVYSKFTDTLKEIEHNMQIGRQSAIQKII
ncbi:hypothetical protein [Emticicia sp. C21]|uniref:hypothetical protein n=1 Tax=Emticicia sp. C21 TaxID=2302915 RepID=UPI000E356E10|nr:hypothetical protein [Emticicia sp. C21]RFS15079.1 hypothetical protein D0T08_18555 [Emticicia sp. C21]